MLRRAGFVAGVKQAALLHRLKRDQRGVSAIEFALLAPVMLLMFFGMIELSTAIMTQRRASHADASIGDLVSLYGNPSYVGNVAQGPTPVNPAITPSTMNDIFVAGDLIMAPSPIAPFETRISSIVTDSAGKARVAWSCITTPVAATKTMTAPLAAVLDVTSTLPSGMVSATPGDSIIMSESVYPFTSSLQYFLKNVINFKNTYYYKPRASSTGVGFFAGTGNTAWNGVWDAASKPTTLASAGVTCSYQTG